VADGRGLDEVRARRVVGYLQSIWRRPIEVHTIDAENKPLVLIADARAA
jgi:hypothetical protein